MFDFSITHKKGSARIGIFTTPHGDIETPAFMPVGTKGSVKALRREDLEAMGIQIILANTYHLYLRPGHELVERMGGLHGFMAWDKPILTDSGGFQVFSLGGNNTLRKTPLMKGGVPAQRKSLVKVTDEGAEFTSILDGSKHFFTPEKVMDIEHALGADIIMAFDECTDADASHTYAKEAMHRTHAWAKRCQERYQVIKVSSDQEETMNRKGQQGNEYDRAKVSEEKTQRQRPSDTHHGQNKNPLYAIPDTIYPSPQALFGIVQGGLYEDLRQESAKMIADMDFPGNAIGGLAIGEEREMTWTMVEAVTPLLPENKPRYLMGVGTPEDLRQAIRRGVDLFDCVLPTRLGRHGTAFTATGTEHLRNEENKTSREPLESTCSCMVCKTYSRAYLRHLIIEQEILGLHLLSYHNVAYLHQVVEEEKARIRGEWKMH